MPKIRRLRLPGCWPVIFYGSLAHWRPQGTTHGAKSLPKLVAATLRNLEKPHTGSSMWRLWVYFRGGYAWYGDLIIDRRDRG